MERGRGFGANIAVRAMRIGYSVEASKSCENQHHHPCVQRRGLPARDVGRYLDCHSPIAKHAKTAVELIVVDNNSVDNTAEVARNWGARVVTENIQGISRSRNSGAKCANGDVLVFVDADVLLPDSLMFEIYSVMSDPICVGGGVDVDYRPKRHVMRLYLGVRRVLGRLTDMVQGSTQFCRKDVFEEVGGYDERAWIGEDVNFYWALKKHAKRNCGFAHVIREPRVRPSTRRFDKWPLWRTLV